MRKFVAEPVTDAALEELLIQSDFGVPTSLALVGVAAAVGHRQQHAVELAAVERVAGRLAGFLAQIELEARPLLAKPRKHRRQQEGRDRRDNT